MVHGPVLKHQPSDFLVRENMVLRLRDDPGAAQRYMLLRKDGYTTTEAVRWIAEKLALGTGEVTFGGLKDEDGITEQVVAVPRHALSEEDGQLRLVEGEHRWLSLHHYGYGDEPIEIGALEGNGFRVVVRNVTASLAEHLSSLRKMNLLFLNYYDTQRFGVPDGPKRTHHVGAAILAGDWELARTELAGLRAPESEQAANWTGDAKTLFTTLDPRTTAFYLAAQSSFRWNAELAARAAEVFDDDSVEIELDGLKYLYPTSGDAAAALMAHCRELPFRKYTFADTRPVSRLSPRPTLVQTTVTISGFAPDEHHPGAFEVTLGFFLPSGCYATAAVRQLMTIVSAGKP
ncbi:tRNA pseudouridine(13) synthase TruD [Amycolatopsis sp. cmx-4-61]|uniref:tRNA pseudouridine(13) synthase TruD n=1 Tax=Amycolatopsis sp. cmx-4-61 TaxID=2790937 RepID=UPI003978921C